MPLVYAVSIYEVDRVLSKVKRYGILKNKSQPLIPQLTSSSLFQNFKRL